MSVKTLLTSEDLWKKVADGSRYELSQGELVPMTPVGLEHGGIVIRLGGWLDEYVRRKRLGLVCTEVGFRLRRNPDTVRAPDVAVVRKERLPKEGIPRKFANFPPDLAVEVLSPEDTASELLRKVEEYLQAGVPLIWVVDPATRTVTVYRSLQDVRIVSSDQQLEGGEAVPGFQCKVSELFTL
jgi:Uma2 family endonuclease